MEEMAGKKREVLAEERKNNDRSSNFSLGINKYNRFSKTGRGGRSRSFKSSTSIAPVNSLQKKRRKK